MRREHVRDLLQRVADGSLDVARRARRAGVRARGIARLRHDRSPSRAATGLSRSHIRRRQDARADLRDRDAHRRARRTALLVTRLSPDAADQLAARLPGVELNAVARTAYLPGTRAAAAREREPSPSSPPARATCPSPKRRWSRWTALGNCVVARHRRRRRRHSSCARASRRARDGRRGDRDRGNGRRAAVGRRRAW